VALADLTPAARPPSQARLGDSVLAIGFPLDLGGDATVTPGIVSASTAPGARRGRPTPRLLQTDAAINPKTAAGRSSTDGQADRHQHHPAKDAENVSFRHRDRRRSVIDQILASPPPARLDRRDLRPVNGAAARCNSASARRAARAAHDPPCSPTAPPPGQDCGRDVVVSVDGACGNDGLLSKPATTSRRFDRPRRGRSVGPRRVRIVIAKRPTTLPG
jgi:hypothetical protein